MILIFIFAGIVVTLLILGKALGTFDEMEKEICDNAKINKF